MKQRRLLAALVAVIALTLAACGSSSKPSAGGGGNSSTAATGTTAPHVVSKVLGKGVTASTVKIGISLVDFTCIEQFTPSIRQNQQQVYQAFISNINDTGGINGRKIVPVFKTYCPLSPASDLNVQLCTSFADDDKVFAVIGNLTDAAQDGSAETCLAKKHNVVVMSFNITQQIIGLSPPGMVIYPGTTPERSDAVIFKLLAQRGTLNGKRVGVLGEATTESSIKSVVLPGLKKLGVKTGTPAYLTVNGSDTTAAQAQLSSFIERWKTEGVNAVFVAGEDVASQQFVEKLSQGLPGALLMTDIGDTRTFGRDETQVGVKPNPYAGMLIAGGFAPIDYAKSANWAYCRAIYKKYTGKTAPSPTQVITLPNGKTLDTYGSINDACQTLSLFHDVAARTGQYLNPANWAATVDNFGPAVNRGGGPYASLKTGKYDFDDTFVLQEFDPTIGKLGDWKNLTPYENISS